MKIGLFATGHFRNVPAIRENFKQFLDNHDTSVYVSTWSSQTIDRMTHYVDLTPIDAEQKARNSFGDNLKGLWIGDMEKFLTNQSPVPGYPPRLLWNDYISVDRDPMVPKYPWPQRVLDQWYGVLQSYLMAHDVYDTFDVCIRIRCDMLFIGKPPVPFHSIEDGIHVNGYTWWTNPEDRENGILADSTNLVPYALSDQLAWGKPHWMRKYFEYYMYYCNLFAGKINVWHGLPRSEFEKPNAFLFNSEHMMSYYLLKFPYYDTTRKEIDDGHDMPYHRHGQDSNPHNRFDADYYYYDPPK